jgi:hypothetical protein
MPIARAFSRLGLLALPWMAALSPSIASAHLSLESAGTHKSRYGDDEIKHGPCGRVDGKRGTNVYTYKPGETITIKALENIPHPSYFRIAFDQDGDDDFVEPKSIKPIDPKRKCPFNADDKCGASDFFNSPAVLMDNLDPHLSNGMQTYTWQVKLPDVECDNCTLQVIQVMEDVVHGAYSPKGASNELFYIEDIYHTCIDLVLKKDATGGGNPTPTPPETDGGTDDGDTGGSTGAATAGNNGGVATGTSGGANSGNNGAGNGSTPPGGGSNTGTTGGDKGGVSTGTEGNGGVVPGLKEESACSVSAVGSRSTPASFAWWLCGSALGLTLWTRRRRSRATQRAL